MIIKLEIRNHYGQTRVYSDNASVQELTGTKTLTAAHVNALQALGHTLTLNDAPRGIAASHADDIELTEFLGRSLN